MAVVVDSTNTYGLAPKKPLLLFAILLAELRNVFFPVLGAEIKDVSPASLS